MSDFVLFQIWEPFRQSLLKSQSFYVEQARRRLLSQFANIESDADRAAEEWLEKRSFYFDPDTHDPAEFLEEANDTGIEFYELLREMRDQTYLSVVAGMFHEWDKQLRDWLGREIGNWHPGGQARSKIWSADFGQIADLLESLGWKVRSTNYFLKLDACRLVINVYKHGKGKSLDDLRSNFPEYLCGPLDCSADTYWGSEHPDHSHLKVNDDQLQAFSDAILAFWRDVPENVTESQITEVPAWLDKAMRKDHTEQKRARRT